MLRTLLVLNVLDVVDLVEQLRDEPEVVGHVRGQREDRLGELQEVLPRQAARPSP